jgi:propanol-preferring alcohol dehydrogenase
MKACVLSVPAQVTTQPLQLREMPSPKPAADEVRIAVSACAICRTAAGHIAIRVARGRGAEVYVCTRDRERHQALASELGAAWVGGTVDPPPVRLDAAIIFAPAGEIVPPALAALDPGGTLVLGGIHMSPIPEFPYDLIYRERAVRSVANNTRADGREFLTEAARLRVRTHVQSFTLAEANQALIALKHDAIRGAGVLVID